MKTQKITMSLKAKQLVVRVTPQDYSVINDEAKKRKQRMSDFVREACMHYLGVPVKQKNPKCYDKKYMRDYVQNNLAKK